VNTYTDAAVVASLQSLPVVSLVTDQPISPRSATGIYVNADQHGPAWERPVSVEMFFPPGWTEPWGGQPRSTSTPACASAAGTAATTDSRNTGCACISPANTKANCAPRSTDPRAPANSASSSSAIGSNYGWFRESSYGNGRFNTMCRDPFARDTQGALGQPHTRTRYVHLYLNGVYWGVHYVEERAEADYAASYLGGRATTTTWSNAATTSAGSRPR
jgi:hypothetical protein